MSKKLQFTIGADPELFLLSLDGQKFISSIGKIGGTKREPLPVGSGCAIQEDNVAVEFNIPPAASFKQFQDSLNFSLALLEQKAKDLNLKLAIEASAEFEPDQLSSPQAKEFGCEPDFNAWTGTQNPRPVAKNKNLRSCGGHVHIGTNQNTVDVIKAMDLFLGCPSTVMDKDVRRRELYGKAGAYRTKPYGCEYRTLSNFWLKSADLMKWVYDRTEYALNWVEEMSDDGEMEWPVQTAGAIQACINQGNTDAYMYLAKKYDLGI